MDKPQSPLSIRVIHAFTQVAFWLYTGMSVILVIMILAASLGYTPKDANVAITLPVTFDLLEKGTLDYAGEQYDVELVDASGKLRINATPTPLIRIMALSLLGILVLAWGVMWYVRKLAMNIKASLFFEEVNAVLLKRITYILLILWLYAQIYFRLIDQLVTKGLAFEQVHMHPDWNFTPGLLIFALFLWVLSHIFAEGTRLKKEEALTI